MALQMGGDWRLRMDLMLRFDVPADRLDRLDGDHFADGERVEGGRIVEADLAISTVAEGGEAPTPEEESDALARFRIAASMLVWR